MSIHQKIDIKKPDSSGRINIGLKFKEKLFRQTELPNGDILLSPVVVRHEREQWLYDNPEAMAALDRALEQASKGQIKSLGSFAEYALDDED
ncbi:MAG TPA: hypothetical protein VGL56_09190 [Fimbriimonadaceae bacterium]|jgi:hypothetical protein